MQALQEVVELFYDPQPPRGSLGILNMGISKPKYTQKP